MIGGLWWRSQVCKTVSALGIALSTRPLPYDWSDFDYLFLPFELIRRTFWFVHKTECTKNYAATLQKFLATAPFLSNRLAQFNFVWFTIVTSQNFVRYTNDLHQTGQRRIFPKKCFAFQVNYCNPLLWYVIIKVRKA